MSPILNAYQFQLDATAPANPVVSLLSSNCDSARVSWASYTPPHDLAGFEVYKTKSSFSTIEGMSPVFWIDKTTRTYELGSLDLNTLYYVAIVAVDEVGNKPETASPLEISISRPVPPQVGIIVGPGDNPDSALVSWQGSPDLGGNGGRP